MPSRARGVGFKSWGLNVRFAIWVILSSIANNKEKSCTGTFGRLLFLISTAKL